MALSAPFDFKFNPQAKIRSEYIGRERQPLLVIDNVLRQPEAMIGFASSARFGAPPQGSYYPGVNALLPPGYGASLVAALRPLLERGFGLPRDKILTHEGFFGLTTYGPGELEPLQCVPHFDSSNPFRLAVVHYFCGEPFSGTAFFRHLPTQYESVQGPVRFETFRARVTFELENDAPPKAYVDDATPRYEQIAHVDAAFDRLVVYRTTSLHAAIMSGAPLSADPAKGRLTANSFIDVSAAA
ncbi:MAG: DUF6445 family protein [Asticcacaulis sp.]